MYFLREVKIKFKERDYFDFLQVALVDSLTVEEKIYEIIDYYLIIQRNKKRVKFSRNTLSKLY
ncbi:MAG: conserved hypothetical protein [Marine Group I thaumarchaeote]|nr:MAG: conserved hypothetical protein [Marine Group I thaumarchaeote]